jgi:UDP:flavonoid glycosyltransferase YjiC (YdhE family)
MKILVCSAGTHGDLQPAVALAKGLLRAGHDVHFASHSKTLPRLYLPIIILS